MKWIVKQNGLDAEAVPVSLAGEPFPGPDGVDLVWVNLESPAGIGPQVLMAKKVSAIFESELEALEHAGDVLHEKAGVLFRKADELRRQAEALAKEAAAADVQANAAHASVSKLDRRVEEIRS
jgi:hypothetical protein